MFIGLVDTTGIWSSFNKSIVLLSVFLNLVTVLWLSKRISLFLGILIEVFRVKWHDVFILLLNGSVKG